MTEILDIKIKSIDYILIILHSFERNIQSTDGMEKLSKLRYIDGLLYRNDENITFLFYKKATNTDVYINWHSFAHESWKRRN